MKRAKEKVELPSRTYRIDAMYAAEVFMPSNAIEDAFWKREFGTPIMFRTRDGKLCKPTFRSTTNNESGEYDERFDYFCRQHFDCSFASIRSLWFSRLGPLDNYWHWITLELIDEN